MYIDQKSSKTNKHNFEIIFSNILTSKITKIIYSRYKIKYFNLKLCKYS